MVAELQAVDRDILDWIAEHSADPALAGQIENARASRRDYTRTGFFVYFEPDPAAAPVPSGVRPVSARLDAPGLLDGAGCDLFLRDGRLHYLEVYARGGFLPETLDDYRLGPDD